MNRWAGCVVLAASAVVFFLPAAARAAGPLEGHAASAEARLVAHWALGSGDSEGKPYAVVDKKDARIFVFAADGRLAGSAPVLLGSATGDDSAPGVAQRIASGIPAAERTTPAGRFDAEPGRNDKGEGVVWVDYTAAVAIHRLRPAPFLERRPQRLASPTPADNRISLGCVIVSPGFYDTVIAQVLGRGRSVVYVLPETRSTDTEFGIDAAGML